MIVFLLCGLATNTSHMALLLDTREVALPLNPSIWLRHYMRGKPTRFAPRPKPAPWRAVTAMEGASVSRRAKVANAAVPIVKISPNAGFLGFRTRTATNATTSPSIRYLRTDVSTSPREKSILYLNPRNFIECVRYFKRNYHDLTY